MHNKKSDILTIVLFCGFLCAMLLMYLLIPKKDYSEAEKRYLAETPDLNWADVGSGDWGNEAETYMADHIPGRDFFVGLNAYFDLYTGRQAGKDIWLKEDRLIEAPVKMNDAVIAKNLKPINTFAETIGQQVDLMIVPSAGWAMGLTEYNDSVIIDSIYASANVNTVDVRPVFQGKPSLYFRTDHHWNSEGAHSAYEAYMAEAGRDSKSVAAFEKSIFGTFQGSTYSRSALWLTPGEDLELWLSQTPLTVTNGETEGDHEGVFYWERLEEADKYTVFLDGNHSIVRISNAEAEGKLLVIRDSYSNSLGCFLAESYNEVVLIDLRYYKQPVSALVAQEGFDDILVCYSIGNFMTDTNLIFLR